MDKHFPILIAQLERSERGPKNLAKAWTEARQAGENSTAKVLINTGGFVAWAAYYIPKSNASKKSTFSGKAACRDATSWLEIQSPDIQQQFATAVVQHMSTPLINKINGWMTRLADPAGNVSEQMNPQLVPESNDQLPPIDQRTSTVPPRTPSNLASPATMLRQPLELMNFPEPEKVLQGASLIGAKELLPPDLLDAVNRNRHPEYHDTWTAAISMSFLEANVAGMLGCQMSMGIKDNRLEWMVRELFDLRLEIEGDVRYLRAGSRNTLVCPAPTLVLTGILPELILGTFGRTLGAAIEESPLSQESLKKSTQLNPAVSMSIPQQVSTGGGGVLVLSLGLWRGTEIRKNLYEELII